MPELPTRLSKKGFMDITDEFNPALYSCQVGTSYIHTQALFGQQAASAREIFQIPDVWDESPRILLGPT